MHREPERVHLVLNSLRELLVNGFTQAGLAGDAANLVTDALLDAELCEVPTHGLFRVPGYVNGLRSGRYNANPNVRIAHETANSVLIDGDNALGYHPTRLALDHALAKARTHGMAIAGVRLINEFGRAAYHAQIGANEGFLTLVCQNTLPMLGAPESSNPTHGNNPLAYASPGVNGATFDAAWTPRSGGEIGRRRLLGLPIPAEWGYRDAAGNITTDPGSIGSVLPAVGGAKGFGMSVLVDLLAGAMTGSNSSVSVPRDNSGVGVFALLIDPGILGEGPHFVQSQSLAAESVRQSGGRWPGDRSRKARDSNSEEGAVQVALPIVDAVISAFSEFAPDTAAALENLVAAGRSS